MPPIAPDQAQAVLAELIALLAEGQMDALPFAPATSEAFAAALRPKKPKAPKKGKPPPEPTPPPTEAEVLRIKGVLILLRNATRDYLDFVALADHLGSEGVIKALCSFDQLYPQPNQESALQQLQIQLSNPLPYDLEELNLAEYKNLDVRWHDWQTVKAACVECATLIFDGIVGLET